MEWALIELFHGINRFLGSAGGELLKRSVEFLVILVVLYMTTSEWSRSKKTHLRLLMFAFGALLLERLIMTVVYAYVVFADFPIYVVQLYIPVLEQFLEILGLILLLHAFLYPAYVGKEAHFKKSLKTFIIGAVLMSLLLEAAWIWLLRNYFATDFHNSFFAFVLELLKVSMLWYGIPFFIFMKNNFGKYRASIAVAFALYSFAPLMHAVNILLFDGTSSILIIGAHPFRLIALLFFLRVMYLKLADKAFLEHALIIEKKKVEHEKELLRIKDDFVSMVSHELRTPLTSMKLYLSLLLENSLGKLTKKQQNTLRVIQQENNRLAAMVTTILDLAKLERGMIKLNPQMVDLYSVLFESEYANIAKEKSINVAYSIPESFKVTIDPDRFRQVFINLLSNAVKFTKVGGSIELSARWAAGGFEFSVADQGPGIPENEMKKLFNKFYQVDSSETRKVGGTGLGLAIVKELVNLHGGKVSVNSVSGKGSVFTVWIPQPLPLITETGNNSEKGKNI